MKIVLVFVSPNTTTKGITEELQKVLSLDGHEVAILNIGEKDNREYRNIDLGLFKNVDLMGIGCPIYHLTLVEPMERFLQFALPKLSKINSNIRTFLYLTYSGITTGKAFSNAVGLLEKNQMDLIGAVKIKASHFLDVEDYPDEKAKETIELFCSQLSEKDFRPMTQKAKNLFRKQKAVIRMIYPLAKSIGKLREQTIAIIPDHCVGCGICADQCIVGAITMDGHAIRNPQKCIYCYRCTVICPSGAIQCEVEKVYEAIDRNKRIVGTEKPENDIFL